MCLIQRKIRQVCLFLYKTYSNGEDKSPHHHHFKKMTHSRNLEQGSKGWIMGEASEMQHHPHLWSHLHRVMLKEYSKESCFVGSLASIWGIHFKKMGKNYEYKMGTKVQVELWDGTIQERGPKTLVTSARFLHILFHAHSKIYIQ